MVPSSLPTHGGQGLDPGRLEILRRLGPAPDKWDYCPRP